MLRTNLWLHTMLCFSLFLFLLVAPIQANAQTTDSLQANTTSPAKVKFYNVYASLWALSSSRTPLIVSGEYVFGLKGRSLLAVRLGFGYNQTLTSSFRSVTVAYDAISIPIGISYILANKKLTSAGELGLQYSFFNKKEFTGIASDTYNIYTNALSVYLGYRYQRPQGGFFFKIGASISFLSAIYYNSIGFSNPLDRQWRVNSIFPNRTSTEGLGIGLELSVGWSIRAKRK